METLVELKTNSDLRLSSIISSGTIKEQIGPTGYEKFCSIKKTNGQVSVTFPHVDKFPNGNAYNDIILTGETQEYQIPLYGESFEYSVKQYFLEHPARDGIQYLFWDNGERGSNIQFLAMIPGLVCSEDWTPIGYLHSYVADLNGQVVFEIPYTSSINDFTISGGAWAPGSESNVIVFSSIDSETTITITRKSDNIKATFNLFAYNSSTNVGIYKIKNVNEFADYLIATQIASKVPDIINKLTEIGTVSGEYYPVNFMTLKLYSSSEAVKNITPSVYKVPVALVNKNSSKVFMIDVTGVSANVIKI